MTFARMVVAARILLGVFYLLSGFNWFFGFISMLPHVDMPPDMRIKHAVVVEMIGTGWMFQGAKILEIIFGAAMLANRAVPLMLAAALPVAFSTFMLDALILDDIARWFQGAETNAELLAAIEDMIVGGLCVLLPHLWLMWCYFDYYRPSLAWRSTPTEMGVSGGYVTASSAAIPLQPGWCRAAFFAFGWAGLLLQSYNLYLFVSLIG